MKSDFDPLKSRMDVIGAGLIPLQDKASEMASQIAALTARIEALEARP